MAHFSWGEEGEIKWRGVYMQTTGGRCKRLWSLRRSSLPKKGISKETSIGQVSHSMATVKSFQGK